MPDPDMPALNDDGMLKMLARLRGFIRQVTNTTLSASRTVRSISELTAWLTTWMMLSKWEEGIKKLTDKAKAAAGAMSPKSQKFFEQHFAVGSSGSGNKSTSQHKAPTAQCCTNSTLPSPEKPPKTVPTSKPHARTQMNSPHPPSSNTAMHVILDSDNNDTDFKDDGTGDEGNEGNEGEIEDEEDSDEKDNEEEEEDPLEWYEQMQEEIQCKWMMSRKHFHQGQDPHTMDICAMFIVSEVRNFCKACIADGIPKQNTFLKGNISSAGSNPN
ncbi:hypothetical protein CPB84DRAFT_1848800 [Gymnopilus junonius]|uniref:Uncharacterized protein n=1 Tax=Gymnopilus junonius TaxID=109634 RepID=A0A9P5TKG4_GYMJU|nr:hypothetical protein CPB84DRAFT_1848800 [Gymnopilus junonius]